MISLAMLKLSGRLNAIRVAAETWSAGCPRPELLQYSRQSGQLKLEGRAIFHVYALRLCYKLRIYVDPRSHYSRRMRSSAGGVSGGTDATATERWRIPRRHALSHRRGLDAAAQRDGFNWLAR